MNQNDRNPKLFSEFPPISTPQWEEKIIADLKGADYSKKLIWKTDEGIDVKPYYRAEDLRDLEYLGSLPAEAPYTRGLRKEDNNWIIRQDIFTDDVAEANNLGLDAINNGADAVGFRVKNISTHNQMNQLLAGIDITKTGIHFIASKSYPLTLELFIYEVNHRGLEGKNFSGSMNFDALGFLLLHGEFYKSMESNLDEAEYLVNTIKTRIPGFKAITVNGQFFTEAGGTLVEELAFSLASANEYMAGLTGRGINIDDIAPAMQFSFGIGSNYFLEIAKLRAARFLWSRIVEQYKPESAESLKMYIHSATSQWNKTYFDPFVNMLRTTTEGMSAAIGNADSVSIQPFDIPVRKPGEFSQRIARNQQLILKEEAYLDKVVDPSAGSYYIENLTEAISTHAWNLFLEIEEKGGFLACVKSGFVQGRIEAAARKKDMDIAMRKTVIIGTNQYPNPTEVLQDETNINQSVTEQESTTFRKLVLYRGAEGFEQVRRDTEKWVKKGKKRPGIFLLPIGNLAMSKARATFSTNFFGCAGYKIIDNQRFNSVDDGLNAALGAKAEVVIICSSDDEYADIVPPITSGLKRVNPDIKVVVAGFPKEIIEDMKAAGVDEFIHVRSNVLETLRKFHALLGITK